MKRGAKDIAAEILEQTISTPYHAPTRIIARVGVSYGFLKVLLSNKLVEAQPLGKRRKRLIVTEKGREFLLHYRACDKLLPQETT
jgi:predicted transcriptional regulator